MIFLVAWDFDHSSLSQIKWGIFFYINGYGYNNITLYLLWIIVKCIGKGIVVFDHVLWRSIMQQPPWKVTFVKELRSVIPHSYMKMTHHTRRDACLLYSMFSTKAVYRTFYLCGYLYVDIYAYIKNHNKVKKKKKHFIYLFKCC